MTEATTRTQAFVFTDIEGSTRLLRALGDEYQQVLRAHDRIVVGVAEADGRALSTDEAIALTRDVALATD